ncbi:MAG: PQQ-dependent sugar dehydrogenase, partial [Gammaproteobacteria bacterium]
VGGLTQPTAMEFAPDGRLFVAEKGGKLRVIKNRRLLARPFVSRAVDSDGERGLLGVAFSPRFSRDHYVYVYHTVPGSPPHNRVTRFTATGDVARRGSARRILDLEPLAATNHNGGAIHFGKDGMLYVAVGDNAVGDNAQSLSTLFGKILRIEPSGRPAADNPSSFGGLGNTAGVYRAIWAVGLRNPFTFAFQPRTSRLFINDVGQSAWEEVNRGRAGANYGWPAEEGPSTTAGFTAPVFAYTHDDSRTPSGCAVTGGAFYNPATRRFPRSLVGKYFFADLCSGWIYYLDPARTQTATRFATGINGPVDLKVGADGGLYYLEYNSGSVRRIRR